MIKHIIPLTILGLALACRGDVPTGTHDVTASFGIAGNSGCYTVAGALDQAARPGEPLSGTISGDVEGTVVTAVAGPVVAHGAVLLIPGDQTWEVTGGIVEPLIGQTLRLEVDVVGAQRPLVRINTRARVVEGARIGNLTYHGITDLSDPSMTTSRLEYHGVICP